MHKTRLQAITFLTPALCTALPLKNIRRMFILSPMYNKSIAEDL